MQKGKFTYILIHTYKHKNLYAKCIYRHHLIIYSLLGAGMGSQFGKKSKDTKNIMNNTKRMKPTDCHHHYQKQQQAPGQSYMIAYLNASTSIIYFIIGHVEPD